MITHYDSPDGFEQLAAEWDDLVHRNMTNTPFQLLGYQRAWWKHLGRGQLHILAVRDEAASLVAIGAFMLENGAVHFNGCIDESDYLDLICEASSAEAAWGEILSYLASDNFPDWQMLDFCNIPHASPTRSVLPALAEAQGYRVTDSVLEVCPIIQLPDSVDGYLANLDKKQRHEVRRKLRRAKGAEVELVKVSAEDDLPQAVDDFLHLLQKSTIEKSGWLNDARRALFHDTAVASLEKGILQLLFVVIDGKKAAALFNFDHAGRIWVYNSGLDPAAFGHLSPGVVITALSIYNAIETGRSSYDLMRGNEQYKYRLGASDTTIHNLLIEPKQS